MSTSYEIKPTDSRKSFYGKAKVYQESNGDKYLVSYSTKVAEIKNGKPIVYGLYSATATRHIKAFLINEGYKADDSKQIMADYGVDSKSNSQNNSYDNKLRKSIKDNNLQGVEAEQYFRFMKKRFPEDKYSTSQVYADEWAVRFKKGNPKVYMDSESQTDYEEVNRHLKDEGQL